MRPAPILEIAPLTRQDRARIPEDAELVERLDRGDAWAKEALYRKYFTTVWGLVLRLLRDRTETEDAVQDVFTTVFAEFRDLRDPAAVRPWILQIAVHQVHRRFRRRKLLRLLGLDRGAEDVVLESLVHPETPSDVRAEIGKLDQVLRRLPDAQRIAWSLRFVEGCSLDEVATACGCSLATVKRRLRDAEDVVGRHVSHKELERD